MLRLTIHCMGVRAGCCTLSFSTLGPGQARSCPLNSASTQGTAWQGSMSDQPAAAVLRQTVQSVHVVQRWECEQAAATGLSGLSPSKA